jgi:hypothetical protein
MLYLLAIGHFAAFGCFWRFLNDREKIEVSLR